MKIAFNCLPMHSGHAVRGVGFYTKYLIQALKEAGVEVAEFLDFHSIPPADLVHVPYFDLFFPTLPPKLSVPTIVTIHDVTPLIFPQHYPPGIKGKINLFRQRLSLRNISHVITDSFCSKDDIHRHLGIDLNKITVTYLAPASHFKKINDQKKLGIVKNKLKLPDKFALFTGNVNWNKNILGLTKAALAAGIDIVLVGKSFNEIENLDHPELKSFKQFLSLYKDHPQVRRLGFVEDPDLVAIYNLASVLLFPSFYEGFGLPILEAQLCQTPVITSKISSLPEVVGEGGLLVDPYNIDEITDTLKKLLTDSELKSSLIEKGLKNVENFSWQKTAEQTIQVYKQILSK